MTETLAQTLTAYKAWLDRQPLATKTRMAYRLQVHQYGAYLALAAINHFHLFLGNDRPHIQRESLPAQAPRALKPEEQKAFLRAVERTPPGRDRAIAQMLFYTAIRLRECVALNLDDLCISARRGTVIMRSGKGDTYREVPLNAQVRKPLKTWLKERNTRSPQTSDMAVFLNRSGKRLTARFIDQIVRCIGTDTHLELSALVLYHTRLTNLVRCGNDLIVIAEMAEHKRLETTRRSRLPSLGDRENAMERLQVEYEALIVFVPRELEHASTTHLYSLECVSEQKEPGPCEKHQR